MKFTAFLVAGVLAVAVAPAGTAAAATLRIAYAGSMGAVMDQQIGPAFEKAHHITYQGVGQGSYALAHLLASKQMRADVFVSITPGPMRILLKDGLIKQAIPVASTQMVIAYSRESRLAKQFDAAATGKGTWYPLLELADVRFGRTDPATDPQGQNIIFVFLLAERYYHQPGLAEKILGSWRNGRQIFTEPSLLTRLESGQLDAASGYLSAVLSQHLPYLSLPRQINLADPNYFDSWYSKVAFTVEGPNGQSIHAQPQPLVFYAGALTNATNSALAGQFVTFLSGMEGRKMLRDNGYDSPLGETLQ